MPTNTPHTPLDGDFSDLVLEKDFDLVLEKVGLETSDIKARFGAAMDISGSMGGEFASGNVKKTLRILHAPATRMDDDGNLEIIAYNDKAYSLPDLTSANVETYCTNTSIGGKEIGGYTLFAPVLKAFIRKWFPVKNSFLGFGGKRDTSGVPAYLALLSDGSFESHSDLAETVKVMQEATQLPLFIHIFLFGGSANAQQWQSMTYRNVDVTQVSTLDEICQNPTALYERLLSEKAQAFYKSLKKH